MPNSVRRAIIALLVFAAVSGWAATIILATSVYAPASTPDQGIATNVRSFVSDYVKAEAGTGTYEQAEHWLTGQALAALRAESASGAAAVPGLSVQGGKIDAVILWRANDQALAETTFTLTAADGSTTVVAEHMLMVLANGNWKIDTIWRIEPDPGSPLLPSASPSSSAETPAP